MTPQEDDEMIASLNERPGQFESATYKALQAGTATKRQQQAAASGIALAYAKFSRASARLTAMREEIERKDEALRQIVSGSRLGAEMFATRVSECKYRLTWYAVNVLQDNLAACEGTASRALTTDHKGVADGT
jgi:hypothetical protein